VSRFAADYFDGQTSRAHPVRAAVEAGQLHVQGESIEFAFPLDRIHVAPPAGQARGVVHLPDARELHSAFSNLVSNAVRYTPEGGTVTLFWRLEDGRGVFGVEDTGIGVETRHIARLTERFYRVDHGRSRETGGTGLGLAIVKHVLTRHQAGLEVESAPGQGSTFRAVFPSHRISPGDAVKAVA